jgi:hypothetical protein
MKELLDIKIWACSIIADAYSEFDQINTFMSVDIGNIRGKSLDELKPTANPILYEIADAVNLMKQSKSKVDKNRLEEEFERDRV